MPSKSSEILRRQVSGLALGITLGVADGLIHLDPKEWNANPILAARGLVLLAGCYGLTLFFLAAWTKW